MVVNVKGVPEAKQYEARVEGESEVAGIAQYIRTTELIAFVHTEVSPEYEGRGVGAALARAGLDEARAARLLVLPILRGVDRPAPLVPGPGVPVSQQSQRLNRKVRQRWRVGMSSSTNSWTARRGLAVRHRSADPTPGLSIPE